MVAKKKTLDKSPVQFPTALNPDEEKAPPPKTADGIAIRIRLARERNGLSLADLHRKSGISKTALHDYESGRTKPGARELKVLCELLAVTPNWVLFGSEDPLRPATGLRALVKLRNSPAIFIAALIGLPIVVATLDEDQLESILTIVASLLEARDKEAYRQLSAIAEVFAELCGTGSPAEMAEVAKRAADPAFMAEMQAKVMERAKTLS